MDVKAKLRELYEKTPKTDFERVAEVKEEIARLLERQIPIIKIYQLMREAEFKGGRRKFTEILQELGLWTIRVGHKKSTASPSLAKAPDTASTPDNGVSYTVAPTGAKIWGGKKNDNANTAPQPVEDNKPDGRYKPGGTTQEDLEKIFGKSAFF